MIKIEDQVWTIKHLTRFPLAYMCQVTKKADGTPDKATEKMQGTGRGWAGKGEEQFHENIPTKGMFIADSVCRWHTDNKLFRVLDPRGFEVEVPTGNIATLLRYCTVINGIVQEECVWGREGGSHILLPTNSEPYTEAKSLINRVQNEMLKAKDLTPGDRVTLMRQGEESDEMEFLGIVKLSWLRQAELNTYEAVQPANAWYYHRNFTKLVKTEALEDQIVKDDKWLSVFTYQNYRWVKGETGQWDTKEFYTDFDFELNPKVVSRVAAEVSVELTPELLNARSYVYAPARVTNKFTHENEDNGYYTGKSQRVKSKDSVCAIEFKDKK